MTYTDASDASFLAKSSEPLSSHDKRTDISNLDPEERELLELYEQGEWVSDLTPERVKELQSYARATLEELKRDNSP